MIYQLKHTVRTCPIILDLSEQLTLQFNFTCQKKQVSLLHVSRSQVQVQFETAHPLERKINIRFTFGSPTIRIVTLHLNAPVQRKFECMPCPFPRKISTYWKATQVWRTQTLFEFVNGGGRLMASLRSECNSRYKLTLSSRDRVKSCLWLSPNTNTAIKAMQMEKNTFFLLLLSFACGGRIKPPTEYVFSVSDFLYHLVTSDWGWYGFQLKCTITASWEVWYASSAICWTSTKMNQ